MQLADVGERPTPKCAADAFPPRHRAVRGVRKMIADLSILFFMPKLMENKQHSQPKTLDTQ
jgi:hypothetical protein